MFHSYQRHFKCLVSILLTAAGICLSAGTAAYAQEKEQILIFNQPIPVGDSVWMAQKQGYFDREKLDVKTKYWSSGTLAMQTFRAGLEGARGFGDFNFGGELPAVNFWQNTDGQFAMIAAIERDGAAYNLISKSSIKTIQDLKGKVIATRKGSSADYGLSRILEKEGLSESDVTIKDIEPNVMPSALDRGDIDAFFMWEPYGTESLNTSGDKVHLLANGSKYFTAYYVLGTWKWYLKQHPGVAARFLKALDAGRIYAEHNKSEVLDFAKSEFSLTDVSAISAQYERNERVIGLDKKVYDYFQELAAFMKKKGILKREFDPKSFFDPGPLQEAFKDRVSPEFLN